MLFSLALIISAPAAAFPVISEEEPADPGEIETAGWLNSGRIFRFYPRTGRAGSSYPGGMERHAPALMIEELVCSRDTLWIGTEGGLFAYGTLSDSIMKVEGPFFNGIKALAVDDEGSVWAGGDQGISVRRGGRWSHYTTDDLYFFERITGIINGNGKMWVTTFGHGCGYISGDSLTVLTRADSLLDDRVNCLIEKNDHQVWFGTESGLCLADSFSWQSLRYGNRIPTGSIEDMILDEEGNIFLAVNGNGVVRYNLGRVNRYGKRNGLPGEEINAFSLDPSGKVWGAGRSGVSTYDGSGWIPLRVQGVSLTEYNFLSICHDVEGTAYLGTDRGSFLIQSIDTVKEIAIPQSFPVSMISEIREYDDVLWLSSGSRIFRVGKEMTEIKLPDPWFEGALTGVAVDRSGILWVSTRFGILQYNNGAWQIFDKRLGLPADHFRWVSRGGGDDLWFGTFDDGILRLSKNGWTHYTDSNGLPSNAITGLITDSGQTVWILSDSGKIARFASKKWEAFDLPYRGIGRPLTGEPESKKELDPAIRFLGERNADPEEWMTARGLALGMDASGRILFCRSDGIFRYSENGWQAIDIPEAGKRSVPSSILGTASGEIWLATRGSGLFIRKSGGWTNLRVADGLSGDDILAICRDRSGRLWAGTRGGGITIINIGE